MKLDARQIRVLLLQLRQMAVNGWSEGIDALGQCEKIVSRIDEFAFAHREELGTHGDDGEPK